MSLLFPDRPREQRSYASICAHSPHSRSIRPSFHSIQPLKAPPGAILLQCAYAYAMLLVARRRGRERNGEPEGHGESQLLLPAVEAMAGLQ
jgi:hypothetical protein